MATLRVNGTGYLVMSNKVTTPSIIIQGVGYIPLFQSSSNTIDYLRYRYTLGNLRVGNYRAATSRTFINHNPSVSISAVSGASGAGPISVYNGTAVRLQAYGADPDGDSLSYRWSNGSTDSTIYINSNNTTQYYNCTVRDPYGGSATSNTIQITWYNRAPSVTIGADSTTIQNNEYVHLWANGSDPDGDWLSYRWNTGNTGTRLDVTGRDETKTYYCTVTDSHGASVRSNSITVTWYSNSWKFEAWMETKKEEQASIYGSSTKYVNYVYVGNTVQKPSNYPNSGVYASLGEHVSGDTYDNGDPHYGKTVSDGTSSTDAEVYCLNYLGDYSYKDPDREIITGGGGVYGPPTTEVIPGKWHYHWRFQLIKKETKTIKKAKDTYTVNL